jgi:hypothetical protein
MDADTLRRAAGWFRWAGAMAVARSFPSSDVLQAALNEARTSLQGSLGWLDHGQAFLAWLFQSATSCGSLIGQLMSTRTDLPEGARKRPEESMATTSWPPPGAA